MTNSNYKHMNSSELRIKNNKIRRQRIVRRQYGLILAALTFILIATVFMRMSFSSGAQSDEYTHEFKYYQSIVIHSGDTLWSIASENYNDLHYNSLNEYMNEICSINCISNSNVLKAGENLIIPYYSQEFKQ